MTFSSEPNDLMRAMREQRERSVALEAILKNASELGMERALERFGSALTDTEKELLKTLTEEELAALKSILSKLGTQILFNCQIL